MHVVHHGRRRLARVEDVVDEENLVPRPEHAEDRVAEHEADLALILADARAYAQHILDQDPGLSAPKNVPLANELRRDKYGIRDYSQIS